MSESFYFLQSAGRGTTLAFAQQCARHCWAAACERFYPSAIAQKLTQTNARTLVVEVFGVYLSLIICKHNDVADITLLTRRLHGCGVKLYQLQV